MRKVLSVLLIAAMIALLIPAYAFADYLFEPVVPADGVNWIFGKTALVYDGGELKDGSKTLMEVSVETDEDGVIVVTIEGNPAKIGAKTLYMPVALKNDDGLFIGGRQVGKMDFGGEDAYALSVKTSRGGSEALYLLGDGMGHNQYVKLVFEDTAAPGGYKPGHGQGHGPSYVGQPDCVYPPYYTGSPYYCGVCGNNCYVDGSIVVGVPCQHLYPALSMGYLQVVGIEAAGDQFGNATAEMNGNELKVQVADVTKADRAAIKAANDDYIRVRVRPVNLYGKAYAAGTVVSVAYGTPLKTLVGTSGNTKGQYVLDANGTFCLNVPGLKACAGVADEDDVAMLPYVAVLVGNDTIYTPVSYSSVYRPATLKSVPAAVKVQVGQKVTLPCIGKNGGALLPLIKWTVVEKDSTGKVAVNGYSITGLKAGKVVLIGTYGDKTVTVTVTVTKGLKPAANTGSSVTVSAGASTVTTTVCTGVSRKPVPKD